MPLEKLSRWLHPHKWIHISPSIGYNSWSNSKRTGHQKTGYWAKKLVSGFSLSHWAIPTFFHIMSMWNEPVNSVDISPMLHEITLEWTPRNLLWGRPTLHWQGRYLVVKLYAHFAALTHHSSEKNGLHFLAYGGFKPLEWRLVLVWYILWYSPFLNFHEVLVNYLISVLLGLSIRAIP